MQLPEDRKDAEVSVTHHRRLALDRHALVTCDARGMGVLSCGDYGYANIQTSVGSRW